MSDYLSLDGTGGMVGVICVLFSIIAASLCIFSAYVSYKRGLRIQAAICSALALCAVASLNIDYWPPAVAAAFGLYCVHIVRGA